MCPSPSKTMRASVAFESWLCPENSAEAWSRATVVFHAFKPFQPRCGRAARAPLLSGACRSLFSAAAFRFARGAASARGAAGFGFARGLPFGARLAPDFDSVTSRLREADSNGLPPALRVAFPPFLFMHLLPHVLTGLSGSCLPLPLFGLRPFSGRFFWH